MVTIAHWTPRPEWKGSQAFYDAYAKKFGEAPDYLDAALPWMSLEILQSAVARAGLDKEKIREIIAKDTFETINGKVRFDGVQNAITPTAFVQMQKGKLQIVWPKSIATASTSRRRAGDRAAAGPRPWRRSSTRCCPASSCSRPLVTGSIYALVALGLNLVYGTLRMLNVAHGDVVMLGAYGALLGVHRARRVAAASPRRLVAALGALAGLALYRGLFRRLLRQRPAQLDPARGQLAAALLRPVDHPAERRRPRLHAATRAASPTGPRSVTSATWR